MRPTTRLGEARAHLLRDHHLRFAAVHVQVYRRTMLLHLATGTRLSTRQDAQVQVYPSVAHEQIRVVQNCTRHKQRLGRNCVS
jgi:hypothetical protein